MTCEEFLELWDRGDRAPGTAAHLAECPACKALLAVDDRVRGWKAPVPAGTDAEFLAKLRAKIENKPAAPRLRGPRPAASGPAPWLRFAAAAVVLGAMGASFLLGRASRVPERKEAPPVAGVGEGTKKPVVPAVPREPDPVEQPEPERQKSDFRDRLVAAAAGTGREAFLARVKGGVDRARWFAAFRSADAAERGAAVTIASILKDAAVTPQLASAASRGDDKAIVLLGELGGADSVAALASIAGIPGKRDAAVDALAATGRPEAGEALAAIGAWKAEMAWRRLGPAAGPALVARLRNGGTGALPAIAAAAWARAERAVPELVKLLAKEETHEAAAQALAAIGGTAALEALAAEADPGDEAVMATLKEEQVRKAVERRMLDVRVKAPDRLRAAQVLLALGDKGSIRALIDALDSPDLRETAAVALGMLRAEDAIPKLSALLGERRHRTVAAIALGSIGSPQALPALVAASRDRGFYSQATRAIALIAAPESVPHLIAAIGDRDAGEAAIVALGKIRDARAVLPLIPALEGENAEAALKALRSITGEKLSGRTADWVRWWKTKNKDARNVLLAW